MADSIRRIAEDAAVGLWVRRKASASTKSDNAKRVYRSRTAGCPLCQGPGYRNRFQKATTSDSAANSLASA
jgi:hypothetical protein